MFVYTQKRPRKFVAKETLKGSKVKDVLKLEDSLAPSTLELSA